MNLYNWFESGVGQLTSKTHTETIDLTIGGNEYTAAIDFEYTEPEEGSATSPNIQEEVTIYKISLEVAEHVWATLDDEYTDFTKEQVLDWIHAKQEQSKLDKQIEDAGL